MNSREGRPPQRPAVLLLNFGGPRDLEEVRPFLYEILRDPNTLQLPVPQPVQNLLAWTIARRRAAESRRQYGEIGGASPIVEASERIAAALQLALASAGRPMQVYVAHRYLRGWSAQTARHIVSAGVDGLLALPLYPHFSYASTGSSMQQAEAALRRAGYGGALRAVRSYPDAPGYVDALCARLTECLGRAAPSQADTVILCSAHGLPEAYVARGDPYPEELSRTLAALRPRFAGWRFVVSYQSRVGPAQWLKPYTDAIVPELAREGVKEVVFLPLSFVNDHIETLFEIGHTYFQLARKAGMTPHLVAAVEHHPAFIGELSAMASAWAAGEAGVAPSELLPPKRGWW